MTTLRTSVLVALVLAGLLVGLVLLGHAIDDVSGGVSALTQGAD